MSESKKLIGDGKRICGKDTRANLEESQWPKLEHFEQESNY